MDRLVPQDHPLLLQLQSLRNTLAQFQDEAHASALKLQRHSLSTSRALDHAHALEHENTVLNNELSTLRSLGSSDPSASASSTIQINQLALSLRTLSEKLSATESSLSQRTQELTNVLAELAKSRASTDAAYELASRIRGREEALKSRERELELKLRIAEEKARMSERAVSEYADLVRALEGRTTQTTGGIYLNGQATGSSQTLVHPHLDDKDTIERLLTEFAQERETLQTQLSTSQHDLALLKSHLDVQTKCTESTTVQLAQLQSKLNQLERDDNTAAKMVSRYMKFSQQSTNALQTTLHSLTTRHTATVASLTTHTHTLTHHLHTLETLTTRLLSSLDDMGNELLKESFGRRQEVKLRIRLVRREERVVEGLRRWLRRSEERLRKLDRGGEVSDAGVWLDEMVQDAKILVDDLDNPIHLDYQYGSDADEDVSLTAPISGSLARLIAIQSTIDDLVDELQSERERRIRAEGALINQEAHDVGGTMIPVGQEKRMEGQEDVEGEGEAPPPPPPKNRDQKSKQDPVFLDDRIPILSTPPSPSLPPPPNTTSPPLTTPVLSADETQPPALEADSAHISINNNTNDIPIVIAEETIPVQFGSPVLPSDLTSTSTTAYTTEAATPTGATEDTQPLNAYVSKTTETDASVAKEDAEKVEGGGDTVTGPVDAESEVEVVHVPQVEPEVALTNVDEEREVEKAMGEEPTPHPAEQEVEARSEPSAADTASTELQAPEEEGLSSTPDVTQTIVAVADVQVEPQPVITPNPAALLSTDSTTHDHNQAPTPPPDRPVSPPVAPQLTPTPSPPPPAPQLTLPLPPPSPPPSHPLLHELQKVRSRYDHIQRAFHDCHLALDSLKSSFVSTPPVRDNTHTTIPHEVLKAIVQRLDDYTEDVRVELEIRISDEEVLGRGYEALLSVPGALQAASPSLGPREAVVGGGGSSDADGEGKETLETIEVQIQAFVDGTDPTVQKALKAFERKLEDLQHDVAVVKRAVYDPQSEILSAPVMGTSSSPVQHPTPDSSGSGDDNGGGGGWTSWIRTPSRPTTPTPAPTPTFGSVMTSRNRTGIRRTVSAFGLSSNNTGTRSGGDVVKMLGLKLPMPDFTFALSASSSVKTKDEDQQEEQDSMFGLGLGLGLGLGRGLGGVGGTPRSRTVSATYMLGMGVKSGGGASFGVVGGGRSPGLMASPLQRRVVSAAPGVGGAASVGVRGFGGARRTEEEENEEEDVD